MSNKYEPLGVFVFPFHGGIDGRVGFKGKEIISGVTNVSWAGGLMRVTTRSGDKRVVFGDDDSVTVEDVVPDPDRAVSRDEVSVAALQVQDYFGATEPAEASDVNRDVAGYLAHR
jgi:hypothetical protein